jgi:hypothetical protein
VSPGVAFCSVFQCVMLVFPPMCWGVAKASALGSMSMWLIATLGGLGAYVWLQPRVRGR